MNEQNENMEALTPELTALDAGLAELGAAERAGAPSALEGRIVAATSGVLASRAKPVLTLVRPEPTGLIGRLSVKRLDWPMRVAAVIAVMIGGWAVIHGVRGVDRGVIVGPAKSSAEAERMLAIWSTLENSGASEQIQKLLLETANLQSMVGGDDLGEPDGADLENL